LRQAAGEKELLAFFASCSYVQFTNLATGENGTRQQREKGDRVEGIFTLRRSDAQGTKWPRLKGGERKGHLSEKGPSGRARTRAGRSEGERI